VLIQEPSESARPEATAWEKRNKRLTKDKVATLHNLIFCAILTGDIDQLLEVSETLQEQGLTQIWFTQKEDELLL